MKRRRRRGIIKIIALLLAWLVAGAALNVAVAWGLAASHGAVESEWSPHWHPGTDEYVFHLTARFGYELVTPCERQGTLLDRHRDEVRDYKCAAWWAGEAVTQGGYERYAVATGWPLLVLCAWRTTDTSDGGDHLIFIPQIHRGILLPQSPPVAYGTAAGILPLEPIWPGFAVNTLFYAGVLWMLFAGPFALRGMVRRRRGRCPACGYPIGQSPVCTECGTAVPPALNVIMGESASPRSASSKQTCWSEQPAPPDRR